MEAKPSYVTFDVRIVDKLFELRLSATGDDEVGVTYDVEAYTHVELQRAEKETVKDKKRPNPCLYLKEVPLGQIALLAEMIEVGVNRAGEDVSKNPIFGELQRAAEERARKAKEASKQSAPANPPNAAVLPTAPPSGTQAPPTTTPPLPPQTTGAASVITATVKDPK